MVQKKQFKNVFHFIKLHKIIYLKNLQPHILLKRHLKTLLGLKYLYTSK